MASASVAGEEGFARFYSYRDPGVDGTLARFDAAADWLAAFEPDEAEMEGYIVATVAAHDAPGQAARHCPPRRRSVLVRPRGRLA